MTKLNKVQIDRIFSIGWMCVYCESYGISHNCKLCISNSNFRVKENSVKLLNDKIFLDDKNS